MQILKKISKRKTN